MLTNTFCHIPGVGLRTEQQLWSLGIHSWDDLFRTVPGGLSLRNARRRSLIYHIERSIEHLHAQNPQYFEGLLPSNQQWRLFPDFRESIAYLDIETTGMGPPDDHITTISLYDGKSVFYYVNGWNLDELEKDIQRYRVLVTYNGKCFDIPFIRNDLGIDLGQAHIDLRYLLRSLGYSGGLKGCEKQLGISRDELDGVDGFFAVLLWRDYQRSGRREALETLLAYNIQDAVNLEALLVIAYNMKLRETPFARTHVVRGPAAPNIPFRADVETVERIKRDYLIGERTVEI